MESLTLALGEPALILMIRFEEIKILSFFVVMVCLMYLLINMIMIGGWFIIGELALLVFTFSPCSYPILLGLIIRVVFIYILSFACHNVNTFLMFIFLFSFFY